jgi:hypothetical protein
MATTSTVGGDGSRRSAPVRGSRSRNRFTLAVLCLASFIAVVDTTITAWRCHRSNASFTSQGRMPSGSSTARP